MVQRDHMPTFEVHTSQRKYSSVVERGAVQGLSKFIPAKAGRVFVITTEDVWHLHGAQIQNHLNGRWFDVLYLQGGETNKRMSSVEALADQMLARGADRTSIVIGFGGGIVTDIGGFVAAIFMRGIPVLQIPTTLLAQVDAAVGGKTGVNLVGGKNLIGSFHQPLAVLIDPDFTATLPDREYRAGLYEVIKCGVIRDPRLFHLLADQAAEILNRKPDLVDQIISAAVRIKAEVVSADEREGDLRRILNLGHTIGHAIEAETEYKRFLHGEAIAWGMLAAVRLAELRETLSPHDARSITELIHRYGVLPSAADLNPDRLIERLAGDKKTLQGKVHFVLPTCIGEVIVVSGIADDLIRQSIIETLQKQL